MLSAMERARHMWKALKTLHRVSCPFTFSYYIFIFLSSNKFLIDNRFLAASLREIDLQPEYLRRRSKP